MAITRTTSAVSRQTVGGMLVLLVTAAVLVFIIGAILYLLSDHTDRFFAWTIAQPLTAALLGAAYLASGLVELTAARSSVWAYARFACLPVLIFATITLWVTLDHREVFHFGPGSPLNARVIAWVWLVVYAAFPVAMTAMLIVQRREPGADPPRLHRLPTLARWVLALQAAIMVLTGLGLLLAPSTVAKAWPWPLTVLTAQAIGAWGVGLGLGVVQAIWEDDWLRLRPAIPFYVVFGGLATIAMLRYADVVAWRRPSAWVLLLFLLGLLAAGLVAMRFAAKARAA